jgi:3-hydroxyisobutyrate dehydrogenase-like beta-hydroxyacid dehydrogenase
MVNLMTSTVALALIGYGEVGGIFAREFRARGVTDLAVYDILFDQAHKGVDAIKRAREAQARPAGSAADAARGAHIVISAVTADAAATVAMQASEYLQPGQIFFDINSASPVTKCACARHVEAVAAHFVEGAVMAPVPGSGLRVPILAGGPHAQPTAQILNALGMNVRPVSTETGRASAMKLCRSIMIKGLEALLIDCATAASKWGIEAEVFDSLDETFPSIDFAALAKSMAERVRKHGIRRAAEMREAADMLEDLGLDGSLARAVAGAHERNAEPRASVALATGAVAVSPDASKGGS